jgi:hypothetical protein
VEDIKITTRARTIVTDTSVNRYFFMKGPFEIAKQW